MAELTQLDAPAYAAGPEHLAIEDIRIDNEFASRLPAPKERETQALRESIADAGIIVPLVVTADGLLLDGHRRLEAARTLGLSEVPVRRVPLNGDGGWEKAVALGLNVFRRHLGEAQLADLGSSLRRIERVKAKERMAEGGREKGRGTVPLPSEQSKATARVARQIGTSRKTVERVEKVKKANPELARRMLEGKISIAGAAKKVRVDEIRKKSETEFSPSPD